MFMVVSHLPYIYIYIKQAEKLVNGANYKAGSE